MKEYIRQPHFKELLTALNGKHNLIQVIVGPRQVGKTTLALQILKQWRGPKLYESADQISTPNAEWIASNWEKIRTKQKSKKSSALLVLDEVQKVPRWSEVIKKYFDEDRRKKINVKVLLLESAALLMQSGLTESLSGRFELHRLNQWSYKECSEFFKLKLNEYIFFGGYPSALPLRKNKERWARYIRDSLIETVISKDVLLLSPVTKPALLRQTFGLIVNYPAQVVSYQKMLGSLQDAGNTTTIASYLQLLSKAFLIAPIEKWSGTKIKQKGSTPKVIILDNGIINSMSGFRPSNLKGNNPFWGRLVENLVGAQLYFIVNELGGELFYWRERDNEVDYVLKLGKRIIAIEVKSGDARKKPSALSLFKKRYKSAELLIVSSSKMKEIDSIKNVHLSSLLANPGKVI